MSICVDIAGDIMHPSYPVTFGSIYIGMSTSSQRDIRVMRAYMTNRRQRREMRRLNLEKARKNESKIDHEKY